MSVWWSRSTGLLLVQENEGDRPSLRRVPYDETIGDESLDRMISCTPDWEQFDERPDADLVRSLQQDYWRTRTVVLAQIVLEDVVSAELTLRVVAEIEEILQTRARPHEVLAHLLVAPLTRPETAKKAAEIALGNGFGAAGYVFSTLGEYQPPLCRLVESWLGIPSEEFRSLSISRREVWTTFVRNSVVLKLLEAKSSSVFRAEFVSALQSFVPRDRGALMGLLPMIMNRLWPGTADPAARSGLEENHRERTGHVRETQLPQPRPTSSVKEALAQVEAIVTALSEGKDRLAARYLRDLASNQRTQPAHAVKSLCNVAHKCKELFRTDFEGICLRKALNFSPNDVQTLCQYGDHLKRLGKTEEARSYLNRAIRLGSPDEVAMAGSFLASVWWQDREFERAIQLYMTIPDWTNRPDVRTAIADIWRCQGEIDKANAEYDEIEREFPDQHYRVVVGKARVAKARGDLESAEHLYASVALEELTLYAKIGYCDVLKLQGKLQEAFQVADDAVQSAPFSMEARIKRATVLGLLARDQEGLLNVPAPVKHLAVDEWSQQYVRGLLLLKLRRFADSRQLLVDRFAETVQSLESETFLRLGAALSLLYDGNVSGAQDYLSRMRPSRDLFTDYMATVLRLHIAVANGDEQRVRQLESELIPARETFPIIRLVLTDLSKKNLRAALVREADLLLAAA